jgi:hypothetical protein
VNHLEADTVQETPGVALGTFSVEYHFANVSFDTGATHSFVTASWVESHNIPVAPINLPMRVSSVGGRTQTDRFCPSAKVQIRGIEFPTDLIVMGNQDTTIDVILGMNWLTKYQASLSWDKRLPYAEFSYNNSYQASLKLSPFEALNGRNCRTPLHWDQPCERQVFGLDILLEAEENIRMVRENLKVAQSRQRSYADTRRRELSFEVGDYVYLKVSPTRGTKRFGVKGKLAPRYIGPY